MRFIESIRYQDGLYHHVALHQARLNRTLQTFLPEVDPPDLKRILPPLTIEGTYKVRLVYDLDEEELDFDLEYAAYQPRKIESLQVMESATFDYSFKFEDRAQIHQLLSQSTADDIIISIDGNITDGSYFNLVFWDGKQWLTPNTPLLNGVRRQQLLKNDQIKEAPISIKDLGAFEKVSLINAMLDLGTLELGIDRILK